MQNSVNSIKGQAGIEMPALYLMRCLCLCELRSPSFFWSPSTSRWCRECTSNRSFFSPLFYRTYLFSRPIQSGNWVHPVHTLGLFSDSWTLLEGRAHQVSAPSSSDTKTSCLPRFRNWAALNSSLSKRRWSPQKCCAHCHCYRWKECTRFALGIQA